MALGGGIDLNLGPGLAHHAKMPPEGGPCQPGARPPRLAIRSVHGSAPVCMTGVRYALGYRRITVALKANGCALRAATGCPLFFAGSNRSCFAASHAQRPYSSFDDSRRLNVPGTT